VHLKTLTLRGFKSFASATTLHLEPGITCVVGPNGSGKSNVVDALAWVMGEQGAKSLRGGRMDDVVFAGTAGRAPLGRAEVQLVIDNTDRALPIDYTEVTLTRTLFRSGGSEYAINGRPCRLLDVQELLSDSGIGREMHVIVGQGQLDSVLAATPETRRGFIEEAAGVLKHRKRKEKALRKLEAMQANLQRLTDLTAELRRQLGPLGRQAEVARRAAVVQRELRDARLRLHADDLVALQAVLGAEQAGEQLLRERRAEVEQALAAARDEQAALEAAAAADAPRTAAVQDTYVGLTAVRERLRGLAGLAAERLRLLAAEPDPAPAGRDPDALVAEAAATRARERELAASVAALRADLDEAVARRHAAEAEHAAEERRVASLVRAAADRREGLARLHGQIDGLRRRVAAAHADVARLAAARDDAAARADQARREFAALEAGIAGLTAGEAGLDTAHETAVAALAAVDAELAALREQERAADRDRSALAARVEALALGLAPRDGAAALLGLAGELPGVLGTTAALVDVEPGAEVAVAAALGASADALVVADVDSAVAALRRLRDDDLGRAAFVAAAPVGGAGGESPAAALPAGMRWARDLVRAPQECAAALDALLAGIVVVDDLAEARAVVRELPGASAVTRSGDVLGPLRSAGGSASAPSLLEVQAAHDEAAQRLAEAAHRVERIRFAASGAAARREAAAGEVAAALARLHESDAELAAVADQLGRLGQVARAAGAEAERLAGALADAERARERDESALADHEQRLAAADESAEPGEPDTGHRDELAAAAAGARQAETEARLALRTAEERARALGGRADGLERAARDERAARARAAATRERRAREAAAARAVAAGTAAVLALADRSVAEAEAVQSAVAQERADRERALGEARDRVRGHAAALESLVDELHRDEVVRAEQRLRIEALVDRVLEEFGVPADVLVAEYGPHQPVPPTPSGADADADADAGGDAGDAGPPPGRPFVRAEQERRAKAAERATAALGRVNPLALEEYAALQERLAFLGEQLEDLRRTRRDLLDIVREVDARVEQVFAAAYEDVAREFSEVFGRLFPGGEGRLVLTEPDDLLASGVDVMARPPGKRVQRLSLLSGGERSLVAVAFLVALFKARPSPFYVLDEVEAALDDVNLGRLLEIYEELRETSQLVVVTHQKRTMELADALYGVSMRGDGVTAVISQRIREPASA
jgi:chromosome segregation protein